MSVIFVQLPSLSPTMELGIISEWKVKEGDLIESDQVIASIATDKSTVDYESLDEGTLRKILLPEGGEGKVGKIIAVITEEPDEDFEEELAAALAKEQESDEQEVIADESEPASEEQKVVQPVATASSGATLSTTIIPAIEPPKNIPQPEGLIKSNPDYKVSPAARRIAKERGINLAKVQPKTVGSRIVMEDLKDLPNNYGATIAERSTGLVGYVNRAPQSKVDKPLSQMRKAINERMVQGSTGVPVFYLAVKVEMDDLMKLRKQLNEMEGVRVSINDFIVKAVAMALHDHPAINSAYQGDFIRQFTDVDISVAVSIDDGLITPIIRSADTKGLYSIGREIKELVSKAKNNELTLEEYQGGSFTISNLGMFGAVDQFTAILNPPQAGILAIGGTTPTLKMVDGNIVEVNICTLTLTADHRVIDGALAATFMNSVKEYLEVPVKLVV